jgi:Ankyrin repeats (3 copies)
MMNPQCKKRQACCARSAFEDPACLRIIHDFLGSGHYAFIAPVSNLWKQSCEVTPSVIASGLDVLRRKVSFLCDSKTTLHSSIFTSTSRVQLIRELHWQLTEVRSSFDSHRLSTAAGLCAELSVLQYAVDIGLVFTVPDLSASMFEGAALAGDLIKLQWLHAITDCSVTAAACELAASGGSIEILQWLLEGAKDYDILSQAVMKEACASGQLQTVQYLVSNRCSFCATSCLTQAAQSGHLNLIKWMMADEPFKSSYNNNVSWNLHGMMNSAALGGRFDVMQWLRTEHDVQYSASALTSAAEHDHLDVIQHLRSEGCPWDAKACTAIASCNHRYTAAGTTASCCATLRWLRDHGCPWLVAEVRLKAAENGNIDILAYAIQHGGMPNATELTKMLNIAGAYGKFEAAQWLRKQGAEWPTVLIYQKPESHEVFARTWHGATLDWARSEGCISEAPKWWS